MKIDRFVSRRKALKISQCKLSHGICTQATLSKFENQNKVPSLTILSKLCVRLGMTVDDLYQDGATSVPELHQALDTIERDLMTENYPDAIKRIRPLTLNDIDAIPNKMQFCYLRGLCNALVNAQPDKILFDFSQILNDLDERHQTIFTQLAFLGSGVMSARRRETKQAAFYFEKVNQYIKAHQGQLQETDDKAVLRMLTLVFFTAEFYANQDNYRLSNQLIDFGIQLCSENRVTYYLPRLKFQAAQNALAQKKDPALIQRLISETLAFARINQNQVVEVKVAALNCAFKKRTDYSALKG